MNDNTVSTHGVGGGVSVFLNSNIKFLFTDTMSILFVVLPRHHHLVVIGVVSQQFTTVPRVTEWAV